MKDDTPVLLTALVSKVPLVEAHFCWTFIPQLHYCEVESGTNYDDDDNDDDDDDNDDNDENDNDNDNDSVTGLAVGFDNKTSILCKVI